IESASVVSDRFVFTDTGSNDRTKEIIEEVCWDIHVPYEIFDRRMGGADILVCHDTGEEFRIVFFARALRRSACGTVAL
ncbi:MAG: hypothetical protein R6V58_14540, partial [Planctomycetota bacterium]